jgi:hypothetical protein
MGFRLLEGTDPATLRTQYYSNNFTESGPGGFGQITIYQPIGSPPPPSILIVTQLIIGVYATAYTDANNGFVVLQLADTAGGISAAPFICSLGSTVAFSDPNGIFISSVGGNLLMGGQLKCSTNVAIGYQLLYTINPAT